MSAEVFNLIESNVRSYCRKFPAVFASAKGVWVTDIDGRKYLDLLSGAGTLNYGHNNPAIVEPVIDYLRDDGILHSLDLHTAAKARFLQTFQDKILAPRGLDYKIQFTGPTGTNAVEAALKLARKVTGRPGIAAFTGGYHGMSLGSLAATCNPEARAAAGVPLTNVSFLPYEGYLGPKVDTMDVVKAMLASDGSGVERPAAVLIELVQGEGGLSSVGANWIRQLARLCRELKMLLIVDDIQAGCGRTGRFFSFEELEIVPDIVVLSKSLSGFGTPFALVLMRPNLDIWEPGEHTGTFRGNNLAFVGAAAALQSYWSDEVLAQAVAARARQAHDYLTKLVIGLPMGMARVKGRGLFIGIEFNDPMIANAISKSMFRNGVIAETCGVYDHVLKLLPPLTITAEELQLGLEAVGDAVNDVTRVERSLAS